MKVIFPPRPKSRITSGQLDKYESTGDWVVQRKFNGQRNVIHVSPSGDVDFFGYGRPHENYEPTEEIKDEIRSLNLEEQEYWFDSELLNAKTTDPNYKNRVVLFDVLQAGKYFFSGPDVMGRLQLLSEICGNPTELEPHHGIALRVTEHIWMAQTFLSDFEKHYEEILQFDEIEGLVLKKKKAKIKNFGNKKYEIDWQIRCRKPHPGGNYDF